MYHYILLDGLTNPTVVSKSKVTVKFKNPNEPVRPRVVPFSGSNVLLRNKEHEKTTTTTKVKKDSTTIQTQKTTKKSSETTLLFELLWNSYNSKKPVLKWGLSCKKYVYKNYAVTNKLLASQLFGPPANSTGFRDYGLIHTSLFDFTQLSRHEKTKIYYIFGDEATSDYSKEHVFYIPPLAGQIKQNNDPTTVRKYLYLAIMVLKPQ